jgi:hypothetical protein
MRLLVLHRFCLRVTGLGLYPLVWKPLNLVTLDKTNLKIFSLAALQQ